MVKTEGRRLLNAYFAQPGALKPSELSRQLDLSAASMSAWRKGQARPESHYRLALQRLLNIEPRLWMTKREQVIADGVPRDTEAA